MLLASKQLIYDDILRVSIAEMCYMLKANMVTLIIHYGQSRFVAEVQQ